MSRALVTGATGFLGRRLTTVLLEHGWSVTVLHPAESGSALILDRLAAAGADVVRYSGADDLRDAVQRANPEVLFHLATLYRRSHTPADIERMMRANVELGTILLDALVGSGCIVVAAMSFFQYRAGEPSSYSLYASTKEAFSTIARFYRDAEGLDVREVVLFDTFGPGDSRDKLIPHIIRSIATGSPLALGPSAQQLNLLYMDDVASGFLAAAGAGSATRTALRAPENVTVGDVVSRLGEITGRTIEAAFDETRHPNDLVNVSGVWPAPHGWAPVVDLTEGLGLAWTLRDQAG